MTARVVVELRGVSVGYGERVVVRDVDLVVRDGEVVAVLGANGSGKTTLVRGLLGLATVLHGEIEVLGRSQRTRRDRARIGYVPQRHTVGGAIPSTVREVVASGRLPRLGLLGRQRAHDRQVVQEAIDAVHLGDLAGTDVGELSGGQQRRVLIARALAAEPEVLVMDEPTAGVDQASQHALAGTIRSLAARGVPMVVVTHEVGPLADVLTRAIVVDDGRITYDGPLPHAFDGHRHGEGVGSDHHHLHDPLDPHEVRPGRGPGWLDQPLGGA
ncbi:metal ABC transporter ATP-binding protein [Angustibacter peucedani]